MSRLCEIPGCKKPFAAKGRCMKHYMRMRRRLGLDSWTNANPRLSAEERSALCKKGAAILWAKFSTPEARSARNKAARRGRNA